MPTPLGGPPLLPQTQRGPNATACQVERDSTGISLRWSPARQLRTDTDNQTTLCQPLSPVRMEVAIQTGKQGKKLNSRQLHCCYTSSRMLAANGVPPLPGSPQPRSGQANLAAHPGRASGQPKAAGRAPGPVQGRGQAGGGRAPPRCSGTPARSRRDAAEQPPPRSSPPQPHRAGIPGSGHGRSQCCRRGCDGTGRTPSSLPDPPGGSSPRTEGVGAQPKWRGVVWSVRPVSPPPPLLSTFLPGKIPLPLAKPGQRGPEGVPAESPGGYGRTYLSAGY